MPLVTVTDYLFPDLEVERAILSAGGCELRGGQGKTAQQLIELTADADCVITQFAPVTAEVIAGMQKAKAIVRYGIGVDNVDLAAARERGIPVCNVPDYCINEVADHTLALMLSLTRRIPQHNALIKAGTWKLAGAVGDMRALAGATVGVVGCGRIGREVVKRLLAFGCRVLVSDPMVLAEAIKQLGAHPASVDQLLAESDVVTLHCPSTAETKKLINHDRLAKMKQGVVLVNVGRGDLVDPPALIEALQSGKVAAAGLDVTDPEPLPLDSPLSKFDQIVITPHIASVSTKAVKALRESVANTALAAVRGDAPPNIVNGVKK